MWKVENTEKMALSNGHEGLLVTWHHTGTGQRELTPVGEPGTACVEKVYRRYFTARPTEAELATFKAHAEASAFAVVNALLSAAADPVDVYAGAVEPATKDGQHYAWCRTVFWIDVTTIKDFEGAHALRRRLNGLLPIEVLN